MAGSALAFAVGTGVNPSPEAATSPIPQSTGLIDISKLNNSPVTNLEGQPLGDINQLLADPATGLIRYAVIHVDAQNDVAVPWPALSILKEASGQKIVLNATRRKLEEAPKWKVGDADRLFTQQGAKPIYDYWAVIWMEEPAPVGESSPSPSPGAATTPQANP